MKYFEIALFCLLFWQSTLAVTAASVEAQEVEEAKANWPPTWTDDVIAPVPYFQLLQPDVVEPFETANPLQEVTHVHHVPVKIPIYANIILRDLMKQQRQEHNSVDSCAASSEGGLKNLLKQAKLILPLESLRKLTMNSLYHDAEVQALRSLKDSAKFRSTIAALLKTNEYVSVRNFVCNVLHLDLKYYAEFASALVNLTVTENFIDFTTAEFKGRPGVRGLLQDIRDILPKQHLQDLYQGLLESDENLVFAVQHLKSAEFRQLLLNFRKRAEYQQLRDMLVNVGVPLDELIDLLNIALGWYGNEFTANENENIKI